MDRAVVVAFVALGSNVGDREAHLRAAIDALGALPGTRVAACSSLHETDPIGPQPQGPYLNAVAELWTTLERLRMRGAQIGLKRRCLAYRSELEIGADLAAHFHVELFLDLRHTVLLRQHGVFLLGKACTHVEILRLQRGLLCHQC